MRSVYCIAPPCGLARLASMQQRRWQTTIGTNESPHEPIVGVLSGEATYPQAPTDVLTGQPLINRKSIAKFAESHRLSSHLWIRASELHVFERDKCFEAFRVKPISTDAFYATQSTQRTAEYIALQGDEKVKFMAKNRSIIFFNLSQIDKPELLIKYAESAAPMYADSSWPPRFSMQFAMLKHAKQFGLTSRYWIAGRILSRMYGDAIHPKPDAVGLKCYYDKSRSLTLREGPAEVTLYTLDQTTDPDKLERRTRQGPMQDLSSGRRIRFECQDQLFLVAEAKGFTSRIWFPSSHIRKLEKLHVSLRKQQEGTLIMLGDNNPAEYFNADQTQDPERVRYIYTLVKLKYRRFLDGETGQPLSRRLYRKCEKAQHQHNFDSAYWLNSFQLVKLHATLKDGARSPFSMQMRNRKAAFYNMAQIANAKEILRASARMRFQKG